MPGKIRMSLQHRLNPLHIYCRLCDAGLPSSFARKLLALYSRFYRYCGL